MNLIPSDEKMSIPQGRYLWLGFAAIIAVVYDLLFWKAHSGVNVLVFLLVYVLLLVVVATHTKMLKQKAALLLFIPVLILGLDMLFFTNEFVQYAVPLGMMGIAFIGTLLLTLRNTHRHIFSFRSIPVVRDITIIIEKWSYVFRDIFAFRSAHKNTVHLRVLYGMLVAVPILLIFGALFYQADAVFANLLNTMFHIELDGSIVWRIFRTILIVLFLGGFFYALHDEKHTLGELIEQKQKEDSVIAITVLALVNVLFLIFIAIQFTYLFGSKQVVLESGLTFAEYARSGFFQLVWVIVLAVALIMMFYRFHTHKMHGMLQVLSVFLLAQVAVIALSALKRMNLYQAEYGFTVLRLYVEWFIYAALLCLLIGVGSIIMRVKYRYVWYGGLSAALLFFVFVSSYNVDAVIARENVQRSLSSQKELDFVYLATLSSDILPEIVPYFDEERIKKLSVPQIESMHKIISRFEKEKQERDSWREYHIGFTGIVDRISQKNIPDIKKKLEIEYINKRNVTHVEQNRVIFDWKCGVGFAEVTHACAYISGFKFMLVSNPDGTALWRAYRHEGIQEPIFSAAEKPIFEYVIPSSDLQTVYTFQSNESGGVRVAMPSTNEFYLYRFSWNGTVFVPEKMRLQDTQYWDNTSLAQ